MKPLRDHRLSEVLKEKFNAFESDDLDRHFESIYESSLENSNVTSIMSKVLHLLAITLCIFLPGHKILAPIEHSRQDFPQTTSHHEEHLTDGHFGALSNVNPNNQTLLAKKNINNKDIEIALKQNESRPVFIQKQNGILGSIANPHNERKAFASDTSQYLITKIQSILDVSGITADPLSSQVLFIPKVPTRIPTKKIRSRFFIQARGYATYHTITPNRIDEFLIRKGKNGPGIFSRMGYGMDLGVTLMHSKRLQFNLGASMDYVQYAFSLNVDDYDPTNVDHRSSSLRLAAFGQLVCNFSENMSFGTSLELNNRLMKIDQHSTGMYNEPKISYHIFLVRNVSVGGKYVEIGPFYRSTFIKEPFNDIAFLKPHTFGIILRYAN